MATFCMQRTMINAPFVQPGVAAVYLLGETEPYRLSLRVVGPAIAGSFLGRNQLW
ncbi:MAG: hypothetical protein QOI89_3887 [Solirubrobacteraceae bacterium]|jgi:hypothetical protein|nr:hypothetical protein [Solirubrobacteraceae bacterium]